MSRLPLLLVLPLLAVACPPVATATEEPGSGFASVSLSAVATGQALLPDPSRGAPGELDVPYAASTIRLGAGRATSSVAWPGEVAANLGSAAVALGAPPQAAVLNDPVLAIARTGSGDPDVRNDSVPGASMEAHARLHDVSAATSAHLVDALATVVGRSHAATRVRLAGPARATGEATSSVRDVTVAGVVHVGAVTSSATAFTTGTTADATGSTVISDLTVAGTAVTVGPDGLSLAGTAVPAGPALDAVNQALAQAGVSIALGSRTKRVAGGVVEFATGSLVLTTPMGVVSLGGVQLRVGAGTEPGVAVDLGPAPAPGIELPPAVVSPGGDATGPVLSGDPAPATDGSPLPRVVRGVLTALTPLSVATGFTPWWVVLGLLAALLAGAGLRRLPAAVLPPPAVPCHPEERP